MPLFAAPGALSPALFLTLTEPALGLTALQHLLPIATAPAARWLPLCLALCVALTGCGGNGPQKAQPGSLAATGLTLASPFRAVSANGETLAIALDPQQLTYAYRVDTSAVGLTGMLAGGALMPHASPNGGVGAPAVTTGNFTTAGALQDQFTHAANGLLMGTVPVVVNGQVQHISVLGFATPAIGLDPASTDLASLGIANPPASGSATPPPARFALASYRCPAASFCVDLSALAEQGTLEIGPASAGSGAGGVAGAPLSATWQLCLGVQLTPGAACTGANAGASSGSSALFAGSLQADPGGPGWLLVGTGGQVLGHLLAARLPAGQVLLLLALQETAALGHGMLVGLAPTTLQAGDLSGAWQVLTFGISSQGPGLTDPTTVTGYPSLGLSSTTVAPTSGTGASSGGPLNISFKPATLNGLLVPPALGSGSAQLALNTPVPGMAFAFAPQSQRFTFSSAGLALATYTTVQGLDATGATVPTPCRLLEIWIKTAP
jgi:hypothetical protein